MAQLAAKPQPPGPIASLRPAPRGAASAKHIGAIGELKAVLWLLEQGYEVFRNVSPFGHVDVVALKDGQVTLIDVTQTHKRRHERQIADGVKVLTLMSNGEWRLDDGAPSKPSRQCLICETTFVPRDKFGKYCSQKCRKAKHNDYTLQVYHHKGK
jgi:hypothetical protein